MDRFWLWLGFVIIVLVLSFTAYTAKDTNTTIHENQKILQQTRDQSKVTTTTIHR